MKPRRRRIGREPRTNAPAESRAGSGCRCCRCRTGKLFLEFPRYGFEFFAELTLHGDRGPALPACCFICSSRRRVRGGGGRPPRVALKRGRAATGVVEPLPHRVERVGK